MKVAITSNEDNINSAVDPRFGRCRFFIIYDSETNETHAVSNEGNAELMGGAGVQAAGLITKNGVEALITGHCGPKAFRTLNAAGIKVFNGAEGTVNENFQRFQNGELTEASSPDVESHW